eukprot:6317954-Amphidinium_carterae.1
MGARSDGSGFTCGFFVSTTLISTAAGIHRVLGNKAYGKIGLSQTTVKQVRALRDDVFSLREAGVDVGFTCGLGLAICPKRFSQESTES